jgi:hypothetical protein
MFNTSRVYTGIIYQSLLAHYLAMCSVWSESATSNRPQKATDDDNAVVLDRVQRELTRTGFIILCEFQVFVFKRVLTWLYRW